MVSGVSPAAGLKSLPAAGGRPVKSRKKLMNIEHRTSNVQHRIMHSACRELLCRTIYFKKRVSEAIPPFDIRHSSVRHD
jgi:hypothetical protein